MVYKCECFLYLIRYGWVWSESTRCGMVRSRGSKDEDRTRGWPMSHSADYPRDGWKTIFALAYNASHLRNFLWVLLVWISRVLSIETRLSARYFFTRILFLSFPGWICLKVRGVIQESIKQFSNIFNQIMIPFPAKYKTFIRCIFIYIPL